MTHLHVFHLHNVRDPHVETWLNLDDIQEVREIHKESDGLGHPLLTPEFSYTEVAFSNGQRYAVSDRALDIDHWVKEIAPGPDPMYANVCAHGCVICAPCNYIPESWSPS